MLMTMRESSNIIFTSGLLFAISLQNKFRLGKQKSLLVVIITTEHEESEHKIRRMSYEYSLLLTYR